MLPHFMSGGVARQQGPQHLPAPPTPLIQELNHSVTVRVLEQGGQKQGAEVRGQGTEAGDRGQG